MASGSIYGSTDNQYIACRIDYWTTPHYAENYSDVYIEFRAWRTNTGYTTTGTRAFTLYIEGNAFAASGGTYSVTYNSNTLLGTASLAVAHGADGNLTLDLSVVGELAGSSWNATYCGGAVALERLIVAPPAPSGINLNRVSDAQTNIAWTNNPGARQPYDYVFIERWDNVTNGWYAIQTLGGSVASYSDTSTVADRRYAWRVRAYNGGGYSAYNTSGYSANTPAAPSGCTATKAVSDIAVAWANNSAYYTGIQVWHAANGTWDGSPLATLGVGETSYTHVAPNASQTHKYKIRAATDGPLYSAYSPDSNTIQLLTNPLAPTNLAPVSVLDAVNEIVFTWQHNPVDGTAQTAYELQYREVGSGTWIGTGKITSTTSSKSLAGGTLINGKQYEWQVRTWGQYATVPAYSPWSDTATFSTSAIPTATIQTPADAGTVNSNSLTATWLYYDAEGTAQTAFRVKLYDNSDVVLKVHEESGTALTKTIGYTLLDGVTYKVGVAVRDSSGQWSAEHVHTFTVDYLEPMQPTLVLTWVEATGSVVVGITNPPPADLEPEPTHNELWRKIDSGEWVLIHDNITPNTSITDYVPAIAHDNVYKAVAVSALPSSKESAETTLAVVDTGRWLWFNGGPGFSLVSKVRGNPAIDLAYGRAKTLHHFAGRTKPLEFTGEARTRKLGLKATLEPTIDMASIEELEAVTDAGGTVCYRDSRGRRLFVSMGEIKVTQTYPVMEFQTDITEVDYSE